MEKLKKVTSHHLFLPVFALALLLLFNAFATPGFFSIEIQNGQLFGRVIDILNRASILIVLALGMTFVIATGGIDISQGSVIAISGAVCCSLIGGAADGTAQMSLLPACLIAVAVCAVCGVLEMARTICTDMAPQKSTPARSTSETAQMPIFPARCVQSRRTACHRG